MEVIGIAGSKGAGKDSAAKLLVGIVMQKIGLISKYDMTEDGKLIIYSDKSDGGVIKRESGIFDLDRRDEVFMDYMCETLWPHVKIYHFADSLKYILHNMFSLDLDAMYGTQDDKNLPTAIKWSNMIDVVPKKKLKKSFNLDTFMSHREVMQNFGDIMRNIDDMCFVKHCLNQLFQEQSPISIIADIRREEEVDAINEIGGKVILLTRREDLTDAHDTEVGLLNTDRSKFYIVLDNQNMGMGEKNVKLVNELKNKGFLE